MEFPLGLKKNLISSTKGLSLFLTLAFLLNILLLFLHLDNFFHHPDIISVKDGFFFISKMRDIENGIMKYNFPVIALEEISPGTNLFKINPTDNYSISSVFNINKFTLPKKQGVRFNLKKLLPFFFQEREEFINIDFQNSIFYKLDKKDEITLQGEQLSYKEIRESGILYEYRGNSYILTTKEIELNSIKLKPGVYIKLKHEGDTIPIILISNGKRFGFLLRNFKNYLLLTRNVKYYKGEFSKRNRILFNLDNSRDEAIFLDFSKKKALLYKQEKKYFLFPLSKGDNMTNELVQRKFFLDNSYVQINPTSSNKRYILFIAIIAFLSLFIFLEKNIIKRIEMKIVYLLLLFLFSLNFYLAFDIHHRFNIEDFYSERLALIPVLLLVFYLFNNKSQRSNYPYYAVCFLVLFLQVGIGLLGEYTFEEYSYYLAFPVLSFFVFDFIRKKRFEKILLRIEKKKYPEFFLMFVLIVLSIPAARFGEAIHVGSIRIELASLLKIPIFYYFAVCLSFSYMRRIHPINIGRLLKYLVLFTLPILSFSFASRDVGTFLIFTLFTILLVLVYFPSPEKSAKLHISLEGLMSKIILVALILIVFSGLLLIGNSALKSKAEKGFDHFSVELFKTAVARTLYHPSTLNAFEINYYQKNLLSQVKSAGSKEFLIDNPFISSVLVNDYMFLYLLVRLGSLFGFLAIVVYCGIFLFSWLALKNSGFRSIRRVSIFFLLVSVSFLVFQSMYQILSQLGLKGIPFTGKEVYVLSCGRIQVVLAIIIFSLLNLAVNKQTSD